MSEANLYAPPKTKVESDPKLGTHDAYRDGAFLLVKAGYQSSRKCVATGEPVEFSTDPVRIFIGDRYKSKNIFSLSGLLTLGALIYIYYFTQSINDILFKSGIYFVVLVVGVFLMRSYEDFIEVFYCDKIMKARKRREHLKTGFYILGALIFFVGPSSWFYAGVGVFTLNYVILQKSFLKKQGMSGKYQRFSGAHEKFLNSLATGSEL